LRFEYAPNPKRRLPPTLLNPRSSPYGFGREPKGYAGEL
jgi:hypothetical protein